MDDFSAERAADGAGIAVFSRRTEELRGVRSRCIGRTKG